MISTGSINQLYDIKMLENAAESRKLFLSVVLMVRRAHPGGLSKRQSKGGVHALLGKPGGRKTR